MPVTSPVPVVVAKMPMSRMYEAPISKHPLVDEGFAADRLRIPNMIMSLPAVTPPLPLMVKLLMFPVKNEPGSVMAAVFANAMVAFPSLASTFPLVLEGELPAIVKVFDAMVNVPDVNVKPPFTVTSWLPNVTPPERLIVRLLIEGVLLNKLLFNVMAAVPPNESEELLVMAMFPEERVIVPLIPSVVVSIDNAPLINPRLLVISTGVDWVTPFGLSMVNMSKLVVELPLIVCIETPLKVTLFPVYDVKVPLFSKFPLIVWS